MADECIGLANGGWCIPCGRAQPLLPALLESDSSAARQHVLWSWGADDAANDCIFSFVWRMGREALAVRVDARGNTCNGGCVRRGSKFVHRSQASEFDCSLADPASHHAVRRGRYRKSTKGMGNDGGRERDQLAGCQCRTPRQESLLGCRAFSEGQGRSAADTRASNGCGVARSSAVVPSPCVA